MIEIMALISCGFTGFVFGLWVYDLFRDKKIDRWRMDRYEEMVKDMRKRRDEIFNEESE